MFKFIQKWKEVQELNRQLMSSIGTGNEPLVRSLLEQGANPSKYWLVGSSAASTPLSKAILQKDLSSIRALLDFNVKISPEDLSLFFLESKGYSHIPVFFKTVLDWFDDAKIDWSMKIFDGNYAGGNQKASIVFNEGCSELGAKIALFQEHRQLSKEVPESIISRQPKNRL